MWRAGCSGSGACSSPGISWAATFRGSTSTSSLSLSLSCSCRSCPASSTGTRNGRGRYRRRPRSARRREQCRSQRRTPRATPEPRAGRQTHSEDAMPTQTVAATHTLPALPYAYDALEPHIDAKTMEIHHTKHHQAYVNNLNAAIEKAPELANKSLDDLMKGINTVPEAVRAAVRNNGGGHWNHSMFWQIMGPNKGGEPTGKL